jgi:hypothetical protein
MIKSGDVFVIKTSRGGCYFQYVSKNPLMGAMIRVLPGIYENAPSDFLEVINKDTNFWIFFPVVAALKRGIICKVGNFDVPDFAKKFPLFRAGIVNSKTKRVESWWLWDGSEEWMVGEITDEQRKLPIRQIWNDTLLIERVEEGWLPELDKF